MIYDPATQVPVTVERLRDISRVIREAYAESETTSWIGKVIERHEQADQLREQMGDRDYPLATDFYFAVRKDATRAEYDDAFELYVCYKIAYFERGEFPWETPFGFREVTPPNFPEADDEDNGLFWMSGNMADVREQLISFGFEEKPDIIPTRN